MSRSSRALIVSLAWAAPVFAHIQPFPLPRPPRISSQLERSWRPFRAPAANSPEVLRTRLPEWAVQAAGGWARWVSVKKLFIRQRRRIYEDWGRLADNREEHLVLEPERFTKYWRPDDDLYTARIDGEQFSMVEPHLPDGAPEFDAIRAAMDKDMFWASHPFLFYRPGIRTRYLGTSTSRGADVHVLQADFDPAAAPYRKVVYSFDPNCKDIVRAVATPAIEGQPVEEYHFKGRVRCASGLRLPRTRNLLIDGVCRETVITMAAETRRPRLPPAAYSREAARQRLRLGLPGRRRGGATRRVLDRRLSAATPAP